MAYSGVIAEIGSGVLTPSQRISHLDGTYRGSKCFTGVQITKVVLKKQNTLSHKAVICINCHFHHCTAKRQGGGGLRASFRWFFSYVLKTRRSIVYAVRWMIKWMQIPISARRRGQRQKNTLTICSQLLLLVCQSRMGRLERESTSK